MKFLHELDADFADLVDIVAADRGLRRSPVEKDYWVTHTLWALQMVELRQLANVPSVDTPAFHPRQDARWATVEQAHQAIAPMFWGPRISLVDACTAIRSWIAEALG